MSSQLISLIVISGTRKNETGWYTNGFLFSACGDRSPFWNPYIEAHHRVCTYNETRDR